MLVGNTNLSVGEAIMLLLLLGVFLSYVKERFGSFQNLSPERKKLVTLILTVVLPVRGSGTRNFENLQGLQGVITFIVPAIVYVGSQWGHQIDRILQKWGDR